MSDNKPKDYVVTELAGPRVNGRRVDAGDKIKLTPAEAQGYLVSGAIAEPGAKKAAPTAAKAKG